ncbi:hypothetical protein Hanom_Chr04g00286651 [Helianthus anomalus]
MNEITTAGGEIQLIDLSNLLQLFFTSGACFRANHPFFPIIMAPKRNLHLRFSCCFHFNRCPLCGFFLQM